MQGSGLQVEGAICYLMFMDWAPVTAGLFGFLFALCGIQASRASGYRVLRLYGSGYKLTKKGRGLN